MMLECLLVPLFVHPTRAFETPIQLSGDAATQGQFQAFAKPTARFLRAKLGIA
jgi:hypothetical protein